MNKKIIGIVIGVVIIIAIAAGLFILKPWATDDTTPGTDTTTQDNSEIAEDLDDYIPDMDKEEIEDTLDQEMSDAQLDAFNDAISNARLPEDTEVNEDGNLYIVDDGIEKEIDHPHQDIIDMTDEEAQDRLDEIKQQLGDMMNDGNPSEEDGNDAGNIEIDVPSNNEGNQGENQETNQGTTTPENNGPTGEKPAGATVWDQEFYDSLTDEQKIDYESHDDDYRQHMQENLEIARKWEEQGFEPITGG